MAREEKTKLKHGPTIESKASPSSKCYLPPLKSGKTLSKAQRRHYPSLLFLVKSPVCTTQPMLVCHQRRNRAQGYSFCTGKALAHTSSSRISARRAGAAGWSWPVPMVFAHPPHSCAVNHKANVQCIRTPSPALCCRSSQAGPRGARLHGTALVAIAETWGYGSFQMVASEITQLYNTIL